jgi:HEAT repeat protein
VEPLIATLKDSNEYVRYCAAEALEKIGWQPGQDESGARYWVIKREWAECIKIGDPAIDSLNVALKDYSEDVRKNAVVALEQIGGVRAVDLLIAALNDGNKGVRQAAAKALVAMYQDHELDHQASYQIICLQAKILEPHSDHHDDKFACGNFHIHHHTDQGVGVDFPL